MREREVGERFVVERRIDDEQVQAFAAITGDRNPVHFDDEAARALGFERRIAQGMLAASLFTEILGNELPGLGTIHLSQTLTFKAPIPVPSTVIVTMEIIKVKEGRRIYTLHATCALTDGTMCVEGEAVVLQR